MATKDNTYTVKTRNWNNKRFVFAILALSFYAGVNVLCSDADYDGKFFITTENAVLAWAVWTYFMLIRPLSGGWTYILRPGHEFDSPCTYKAIY